MLDKIIPEAGDFKVAVYQHILPYLMQELIVKFYQKIKKIVDKYKTGCDTKTASIIQGSPEQTKKYHHSVQK